MDGRPGPVDGPTFDGLLDVSRRMTGALRADEVTRIAVDETSEFTDARAGAFVRVRLAGADPRFEVALERVRAAIERTPIDAATGLELADEQLYAAKRDGRNRVRVRDLTSVAADGLDVSTRIARPDPTGVG